MQAFIVLLYHFEVGLYVTAKLKFFSAANPLGSPVEEACVHGDAGFLGIEDLVPVHMFDKASDKVARIAAVHGDASARAEYGPQGPEEQFALDHHVRDLTETGVEQICNYEIPE